jgi:hypothetical protein
MNFLTKEQYLACLSCVTSFQCVQMFWKITLEINPVWGNISTLVMVKKEWSAAFASINGFTYSDPDVEVRVRALADKPFKDRHWNPLEFFVYPFATPLWEGRYKAPHQPYRSAKVIKQHLVYLDEIRSLVKRSPDTWRKNNDDALWITAFNHTEPKYQDLRQLVQEAKKALAKLEVLEARAKLRKK